MASKNNSAGKPYFSQRDNAIKPESACNVTSMVAALSAAGWTCPASGGAQAEDALMRYIMTDAAVNRKWRALDPAGKIPPNEWHAVLAFAANRWLASLGLPGSPVSFRESVGANEIRSAVLSGGAAVVSGAFPSVDGILNHVVAVVGVSGSSFIIDDPWGDFRTGYESQDGNDVEMTEEEFARFLKPQGSAKKWAHLVSVNPDAGKKEKQESFAALD